MVEGGVDHAVGAAGGGAQIAEIGATPAPRWAAAPSPARGFSARLGTDEAVQPVAGTEKFADDSRAGRSPWHR